VLNLSRKTDYGFYLLTLLAEADGRPLSLKKAAEDHDLSFLYLQEVAQTMRRAGFVGARRGPNGGYYLAKTPAEIRVLDVVQAIDGPLYHATCISTDGVYACARAGRCPSRHGLARLKDRVVELLAATTVADLVADAAASREQRTAAAAAAREANAAATA